MQAGRVMKMKARISTNDGVVVFEIEHRTAVCWVRQAEYITALLHFFKFYFSLVFVVISELSNCV